MPRLLAALEAHGLDRDAVDYVIPTHVHLDHAGGAGLLMQELPKAKLVIHPRGARHMIDPSVLMEGVRAVYGKEVAARDYGELVPVPAERVVTTSDGMVIELGGRPLRFMDTPGHARHHHCIWDEASRGWFTGDTFGIVYPELALRGPYIVPATAPVQFDQQALHESVARLLASEADVHVPHALRRRARRRDAGGAVPRAGRCDGEAARALRRAGPARRSCKRAFGDIYIAELRRSGRRSRRPGCASFSPPTSS